MTIRRKVIPLQRLTQAELEFVGNCNVFLIIVDVIGQLVIQFGHVGKFGVPVDLAGPPAEKGQMFAEATAHPDEFKGLEYVFEAGGHRLAGGMSIGT
jgi:hypothetical protein